MEGLLRGRLALVATLVCVAACGPSPEPRYVDVVDLLAMLPAAQLRAAPPVENSIRADLVGPPGDLRPALRCETPARVIWTLPSASREGRDCRDVAFRRRRQPPLLHRRSHLRTVVQHDAVGRWIQRLPGIRSLSICPDMPDGNGASSTGPQRCRGGLASTPIRRPEVSWRGNDRRYR